jgi:hypothetical protein
MVEIPSKYDFHRKFIYELLSSIRHKVLKYGCTPENTKIESILKCMIHIEVSLQYAAQDVAVTTKVVNKPLDGSQSRTGIIH